MLNEDLVTAYMRALKNMESSASDHSTMRKRLLLVEHLFLANTSSRMSQGAYEICFELDIVLHVSEFRGQETENVDHPCHQLKRTQYETGPLHDLRSLACDLPLPA